MNLFENKEAMLKIISEIIEFCELSIYEALIINKKYGWCFDFNNEKIEELKLSEDDLLLAFNLDK